jgi:hypothetical protein
MPKASATVRPFANAARLVALLVLCTLGGSVAEAAPRHGRRQAEPAKCSVQLTLRLVEKQPNSGAGPIAHHNFRVNRGLPHTTTLFQRGLHARSSDDAAIQNDALTTRTEKNDSVSPRLQPLGIVASSVDRLPSSATFSSPSPRGPPNIV